MQIAVLSGKGGTGKTTVATNLALNIENTVLADADVEEPNSHIFLQPNITKTIEVTKAYPKVNYDKCDFCGKCGDFCRYNAILPTKKSVIVMHEACHDCGGCALVCPNNAIEYLPREIGKIYSGKSIYKNLDTYYGLLNIGELSGVRIIEDLRELLPEDKIAIIDSPPGTSCATVAAVEDSDYAVLVSEPTPFGVSDMKMVVEMLREMNINFGVVINKAGLGDNEIYDYCNEENIKILGEIPFDKKIASYYSEGKIFTIEDERYQEFFKKITENILLESQNGKN